MIKTLLNKLRRSKPKSEIITISEDTAKQIEQVLNPPKPSRGRVIKQTKPAEYKPFRTGVGGKVIKTMPRALQKIKTEQEKTE